MSDYKYKRILVVSDNIFMIKSFYQCTSRVAGVQVNYCCSKQSSELLTNTSLPVKIEMISIKDEWENLVNRYDLIFSLHCKQLFPAPLVNKIKCINVHPGYNPYNRGWFPQVFSILNKLPAGATIHEIDEQIDHGPIIARRKVEINNCDTSFSIYNRVQETEVSLLKENIKNILTGNYITFFPEKEGNVNLKQDFNSLCRLNLDQSLTMQQAIDILRALTHGEYKNAFFIDEKTGEKIYVSLNLERKSVNEQHP